MSDDAIRRLEMWAQSRRNDPDNRPIETEHWAGYLEGVDAMKPLASSDLQAENERLKSMLDLMRHESLNEDRVASENEGELADLRAKVAEVRELVKPWNYIECYKVLAILDREQKAENE